MYKTNKIRYCIDISEDTTNMFGLISVTCNQSRELYATNTHNNSSLTNNQLISSIYRTLFSLFPPHITQIQSNKGPKIVIW